VTLVTSLVPWVSGVTEADPSDIYSQREMVTEALWSKVSRGQRLIGSYELDIFFSKYDPNSIQWLDLFEQEFLSDPESWIRDFQDVGVTEEFARAYFRALDVYMEDFYPHLTYSDMDDMIDICETITGGDGFGYINQAQFYLGMNSGVLRGVSIMLLFTRYNTEIPNNSQELEAMTYAEFVNIFHAMDLDGDGGVRKAEMRQFWVQGKYGIAEYGRALFNGLDLDEDGWLSTTEWDIIFNDLDCRDWDGLLDTEELWQLDMVVHGERIIGGICTLRRDYYEVMYFLRFGLGLGERSSRGQPQNVKHLW